MRSAQSFASSNEVAVPFSGIGMPSLFRSAPKRLRSSARSMESGEVPMMGAPASESRTARLRGVCPPNWTMMPSGFSTSTMFITSSNVSGSK
jgi:hypothetical protein